MSPKFWRSFGVAVLDGVIAAVTSAGAVGMTGGTMPIKALVPIALVGAGKGVLRFLQSPDSETVVTELPKDLPTK